MVVGIEFASDGYKSVILRDLRSNRYVEDGYDFMYKVNNKSLIQFTQLEIDHYERKGR